jgi:Protein of unknown function (DUF3810)
MTARRRPGLARLIGLVAVVLAVAVALAPRPDLMVERVYAARFYPAIQAAVTGVSNAVPFAIFDVVLIAATVAAVWLWTRAVRLARRTRTFAPLVGAAWRTAVAVAIGYLWFVLIWGLNYARPPLDQRLGLPEAPATAEEVAALSTESVERVNTLYAAANVERFVPYSAERDIGRVLHAVETQVLRRPRTTVPSSPKPTLLATYFRMAGVDGLTAPAALETLLNADLTPAERPFVLAHEWAHLSGEAPEADANFLGWLVATDASADVVSRYSGWLFVVMETAAQVPPHARRAMLARLNTGPRADLDAIAARARLRVDLVQRLGWRVYDSYLRSQGVREGIVSYSRVVDLIARASRPQPWRRATPAPGRVPQ